MGCYLVAEWIHFTLFGDNSTHYKTESVHSFEAATRVIKRTSLS